MTHTTALMQSMGWDGQLKHVMWCYFGMLHLCINSEQWIHVTLQNSEANILLLHEQNDWHQDPLPGLCLWTPMKHVVTRPSPIALPPNVSVKLRLCTIVLQIVHRVNNSDTVGTQKTVIIVNNASNFSTCAVIPASTWPARHPIIIEFGIISCTISVTHKTQNYILAASTCTSNIQSMHNIQWYSTHYRQISWSAGMTDCSEALHPS